MKKNLFLRLCLITIALLSSQSCRQDLLPEKETYHNTSAFQLTSKRISLNESKHKAKLVTEIEKAESKLKAFSKTNAQGKVVNYGNGVSIDTDEVIYIENGANYHTYTFNLTRDNALPTDPVENLVLTPLADGSYKELLVSYNLTSQEKEALMMGASVDTKGKTTITELAKGTFNSGGQLARFNCGYQSTTVWVNCCHGYHNPTNVDDWASCVCPPEGQPNVYTVVSYVCAPVFETISPTDPGGSSGGGGGGGSTPPCTDCPPETQTPTEPCNGNGVLTGPLDPVLSSGDGGCGGVVTIPTLPIRNNPCEKIKAKFADIKFKEKVAAIDKPEVFADDSEMGYASGYLDANTAATETQYVLMENNPNTHKVKLPDGNQYFGYMHSHTNDTATEITIKIFSPADVATFLTSCVSNADGHMSIGDAYAMVITSEGNYMLQYSGTGDYSIGDNQIKNWKKWYKKEYGTLIEDDKLTKSNVEKTFARFLTESVNIPGLEVYYVEKDTGKAFKINPDGTKTPCP